MKARLGRGLKSRIPSLPEYEALDIGFLAQALVAGRAETVASVEVDAEQDRAAAGGGSLEPGIEFGQPAKGLRAGR